MPERPGDFLRWSADLVQGFMEEDPVLRAAAFVAADPENHACALGPVCVYLAQFIASAAAGAGEDMGPELARWRQAAQRMDIAAGEAPSPN